MEKNGDIVSYTAEELRELHKLRPSQTDWARVDAMTEEELEAAIASDPDEAGLVWDYDSATVTLDGVEIPAKEFLSMRIDDEILEFFKKGDEDFRERIRAVLRAHVDAETAQTRKKSA